MEDTFSKALCQVLYLIVSINPHKPYETDIITPVLQMRKLSLRGVRKLPKVSQLVSGQAKV